MKPGAGKQKGSSFERWVAKELSLWFSGGKRDDIFWRTHCSGMLGTRSGFKNESGDIMSVDAVGKVFTDKYHIECRCGKYISVDDIVYREERGSIGRFLEEGMRKAQGKKIFGFVREQRKSVVLILERDDWMDKLGLKFYEIVKCSFGNKFYVLLWEDFKKSIVLDDVLRSGR